MSEIRTVFVKCPVTYFIDTQSSPDLFLKVKKNTHKSCNKLKINTRLLDISLQQTKALSVRKQCPCLRLRFKRTTAGDLFTCEYSTFHMTVKS